HHTSSIRLRHLTARRSSDLIILTSRFGQSLRFHEETIRTVGRNAQGVRGMKLRGGDTVVALTLLEKDHLLTLPDVGFGKRTEFRSDEHTSELQTRDKLVCRI